MKSINCNKCGSPEYEEINGYRICKYCGTRFLLRSEDMSSSNSIIDLDNDISILLKKCESEPKNARRFANLILDIDPTNLEAKRYLK